jgi:tRNA-specific 2-thiouridylase
MKEEVMVAMSGGVDSSVAALLLLEQGYRVSGVTLRLFDKTASETRVCRFQQDVKDAENVASRLGIRYEVLDLSEDFRREVVSRFVGGYEAGRTPNPCIDCNRYIKFGKLAEFAARKGAGCLATGHYARVEYDAGRGRWLLKKAKDVTKDQTYVLYSLSQEVLSHTLFPLGSLCKSEVRELALKNGLVNSHKPDSEDICFIPDGDYAGFLENQIGISPRPGNFIDQNGHVLGAHRGLIHYTVGQRKGLGLSFAAPRYVLGKNAEDNTVVLGENKDLFRDSLTVSGVNWIAMERLEKPMKASVKIRYSQTEAGATVSPLENGRISVRFDRPQRAVTPGQAAVFYKGDLVLGGGTIEG